MIRRRWIFVLAAFVATLGLADSGYLTIKHLQGRYVRCEDECSAVLGSKYAVVSGVPLAAIGATAYCVVLAAAVAAALGYGKARPVVASMATAMALTSLWLVYLQAFVIHAFCPYCMLSATACVTLAGLILIEWLLRRRLV